MTSDFSMIASVAAPVFALSMNGPRRFLVWNDYMEKVTGIPAEQARDQSPEQLFGPAGRLLEHCSGCEPVTIEGLGAATLSVVGDTIIGTVSDHERETFLGMAAHDLRAPLRNILFLADEAMHDTYAARALLSQIKKVARQGIALTNDVVSCAQSTDLCVSEFRKFSLRPLCETILATLDADVGHQITVNDMPVMAERPVFQTVLRNLLDNAIRHGGHRRIKIDVDVQDSGGGLQLFVSDNGDGFQSPARALLGGGEFRVESGYGLIGIRRLVRSRGGSLSIHQVENKPGSTVIVALPGYSLASDQVAEAS